MNQTSRDLLFGLLGVIVMLGVLAVATQLVDDDGGQDVVAVDATSADPGDGSDLTVATTGGSTTGDPSSTTSSSMTTSAPPDATTIVAFESSEPELWEDGPACADRPRTSELRATVAGPHDLAGAVLGWAIDGPDFEMTWIEMTEVEDGVFAVEIGPFPPSAVADGSAERILLAVEVGDETGAGAYDDSSLFLQLWDCEVSG
jgi:hypothetical protein